MKIVEVATISASVQKDTLTYFSSKEVSVGDIVEIKVRNKTVSGLVLNVSSLDRSKVDIKSAGFSMKKIERVVGHSKFYDDFFEAAKAARDVFVGNLGQIIDYFLPSTLLESYEKIPALKKNIGGVDKPGFFALQKTVNERLNFYKKYICESFAARKSIHLVLPTIAEAKEFAKDLSKNTDNVFLIIGSEKNFLEKYSEILESNDSMIIISTPSCLFIPRHDVGTIVIEHESSSAYRTIKMPYFDLRSFAVALARAKKADLIFADEILSVETVVVAEDKDALDFNTANGAKDLSVVDMTNKENLFKKSFLLSEKTAELIKAPGRVFLFALRKGLATQVVCHDCKHVLTHDGEPLVLHEHEGKRILRSAYTRKVLDTKLRCPICGSWNFDQLGIGTERVVEEVQNLFPKKKVFIIDKDSATAKKARETIKEFYETTDAVLVGTEMAMPYLTEPIENSAVISIETLHNIPSYKAYERMLRIILAIKKATKNSLIVQTRNIESPVLEALEKNNLKVFFKEEIKRREIFGYPPFSTIIKLTHTSSKDERVRIQKFSDENLSAFNPSLRSKRLGRNIETSIVIKLPAKYWNIGTLKTVPEIDQTLGKTLQSLGPEWQIRINPENLF